MNSVKAKLDEQLETLDRLPAALLRRRLAVDGWRRRWFIRVAHVGTRMNKHKHSDHPAVKLGHWLKEHRQRAGLVARVFAGQIELSPSEYAEMETGVVRWLGEDQARFIPSVLALSASECKTLERMLANAREAKALEFEDLFTREQLEPVRPRREGRKRLTAQDKREIVEAVFTPLK